MRIAIVGAPAARAALRRALGDTPLVIAGEAASIEAGRRQGLAPDAWLVAPDPPDEAGAIVEPLTVREVEVLELVAEGLPNKAIARRLAISDQTVKFHVASICGKLGAANRTEAVRLAIKRALITI